MKWPTGISRNAVCFLFAIKRFSALSYVRKLIGKVEQRGFALVPINLHYKNGRIKLDFGLGRGKKLHDKRDASQEKDWAREKERLMKHDTRSRD